MAPVRRGASAPEDAEAEPPGMMAARHHATVIALLTRLLHQVLEARNAAGLVGACMRAIGLPEDATAPDIAVIADLGQLTPEAFAFAAGVLTTPETRKPGGVVLTPPDVARLMAVLGLATLCERRSNDAGADTVAARWVERLLDPTPGSRLGAAPLDDVRLVDPAGGTGTFLLAAARVLEQCARARDVKLQSRSVRTNLLRNSLHAYEVSPTTVLVARFSLLLYWLESFDEAHAENSASSGDAILPEDRAADVPDLRSTIVCADPLTQRFSDDDPDDLFDSDEQAIPIEPHGFDLVLANPPYVRQELIPRQRKSAIHERFASGAGAKISKRSDLYVYFFALLPRLLHGRAAIDPTAPIGTGGVAVMLASNSWLNAGYGIEMRRFLKETFEIHLVLEPADERWFGDSSVHTGITLLSARSGEPAEDDAKPTAFVSSTAPIAEILRDPAWAAQLLTTDRPPVGMQRTEIPANELSPGPNRRGRDDRTPWRAYLSAPPVHREILSRAGERLRSFREVAELRFGLKTGANGFFYVRDVTDAADSADPGLAFGLDPGEFERDKLRIVESHSPARGSKSTAADGKSGVRFLIESRFLKPVLITPKEVRTLDVDAAALSGRAIVLPRDRDAIHGTHAEAYVQHGEDLGFHLRPSCASRNPWWSLPGQTPPRLVHALIAHERSALFRVPDSVLVDANLVWIDPRDADVGEQAILVGMLSSFGLLCRELYLMTNLGDGALKANPIYLGEIPVPATIDPGMLDEADTAIRDLARDEPRRIEIDIEREERHRLDDLFLRIIGYSSASERWRVRSQLQKATLRAMRSRIRRSSTTRTV